MLASEDNLNSFQQHGPAFASIFCDSWGVKVCMGVEQPRIYKKFMWILFYPS